MFETFYYAYLLHSRSNAFHQVFRKIKTHEVKKKCFLDDLTWNGSTSINSAPHRVEYNGFYSNVIYRVSEKLLYSLTSYYTVSLYSNFTNTLYYAIYPDLNPMDQVLLNLTFDVINICSSLSIALILNIAFFNFKIFSWHLKVQDILLCSILSFLFCSDNACSYFVRILHHNHMCFQCSCTFSIV